MLDMHADNEIALRACAHSVPQCPGSSRPSPSVEDLAVLRKSTVCCSFHKQNKQQYSSARSHDSILLERRLFLRISLPMRQKLRTFAFLYCDLAQSATDNSGLSTFDR